METNLSSRVLARLAAPLALATLLAVPSGALAQKTTLAIGLDISDAVTLDPARLIAYSPPLAVKAAYDTLVTMDPGDYINVKPNLATSWQRTPDGKGWRFKLREGVKFASGNALTAEDVKFSFDRILNIKDQPREYISHVERVNVVDPTTVDIVLSNPSLPLLTIIAAPAFSVVDRKVVLEHGGDSGPDAKSADKAVTWLNGNSAGSGPYTIVRWEQNVSIQLVRNPHYWRGTPGYERVVILHMADGGSQLLALKRGDIDVAFNLVPEQVASARTDPNITIQSETSLDAIYLALTVNPDFNPALAKKEARQAFAYSLDYDGIIKELMAGAAVRPVNFIPIGENGSTEALTKEIGFRQDLPRARKLLTDAGLPNGYAFELSYANASIAGISYQSLAQKIQADAARVGIRVELKPMAQANLRTQFRVAKSTAALTFKNPPAADPLLEAAATVERVAARLHWTPPQDLKDLVYRAAAEQDIDKQARLWRQYQEQMTDVANFIVLIQPIYRVGVRKTTADFQLTGAGWMADLYKARPVK